MRGLTALLVLGAACSAGGTPGAKLGTDVAGDCAVQLPARGEDAPAPAPAAASTRAVPASRVVVHMEQDLAALTRLLEQRVQRKVGAGRFSIGPAGTVSYEAIRGPISASVAGGALVVETLVHARAEACRGTACYASCEPEATVRAEVPLALRSDYRFQPARVTLAFKRGCKVRTLAGFLTIDVTPSLESQLQPQLARAASELDRQLPDVRAEAERGWLQAAAPRPLPLLGCFVLAPEGVVQGPVANSTSSLRARFALVARPELRVKCGESLAPPPLPPLKNDPALPEEGTVRLGMLTQLVALARAFESASPAAVSDRRFRIRDAQVAAHGDDVLAQLSLTGDICGDLTLQASPAFTGDASVVGLSRPRLSAAERERVASSGVDPDALLSSLAGAPHLPPLLSVSGFRASAPAMAAALSQPTVAVHAQVSSARAGGAAARDSELVAWLEADGSVTVKPRLPQ